MLGSMVMAGCAVWYPAHMARTFGWGPGQIGVTLGVTLAIASITGKLICDYAVDAMYRRRYRLFCRHLGIGSDETRDFFAQWSDDFFQAVDTNPVLLTLAHHPKLANAFSGLNVHLLTNNTLPVKQRQIAIMRTTWICKSVYMWSSHLRTSQRCGLSPEMFGPLQRGAQDPYFTDFERAIVSATEELVSEKTISDANWDALSTEWDEQQLLDFLFTVGCYEMAAGVMNATGVQRNDELLALAAEYGAPEP